MLSRCQRRFHRSPVHHLPPSLANDPNNAANKLFLEGKNTFFRRHLPPPCIELSSPEGTRLFTESLLEGNAVSFFRLMEQLHTQNEPEYCGLASLVTVLNALDVDPKRIWKGNWRFYSEELLNCCEPLGKVKQDGIHFDKLASLARCNGLFVNAVRGADLPTFTEAVQRASQVSSSSLILAYSRKVLGQTGSGHYSPMGAYHRASNQLLILDCARFKYRPHWAPLPLVFDAMQEIDEETMLPRGFMELSPTLVPPNNAIIFKLTLKPNQLVAPIFSARGSTTEAFLQSLADKLEQVFEVNIRTAHCDQGSDRMLEKRKELILKQILDMKRWEPESMNTLQRMALVLSFLNVGEEVYSQLTFDTKEQESQVREWAKPSGEALGLELSFAKEQLKRFIPPPPLNT